MDKVLNSQKPVDSPIGSCRVTPMETAPQPAQPEITTYYSKQDIIRRVMELIQSNRFERFYGESGLFGRFISGDLEYEAKIGYKEAKAQVETALDRMLFSEK